MFDNTVPQTNSTFLIRLLEPSPGVGLGAQAGQEIGILDDDTFRFSEEHYRVDELSGEVDLSVIRGIGPGNFLVRYETVDGSAKAGSDYLNRTGTLQFDSWWQDVGYRTLQIPIRDNRLIDGDRTFSVTLRNPTSGLPMGPNSSVPVTLLDNDTRAGPAKGFNGSIHAAVGLADGRILVGGWFTSVDGWPRAHVARLHPDGRFDPTFDSAAGPDGAVTALAVDSVGNVLVGGRFTEVASLPRMRVARLRPDGLLDPSFDPGGGWSGFANRHDTLDTVFALAVQPDGRILTGGSFTNFNGVAQGGLARLLPDGTLDTMFTPQLHPLSEVHSLALQPDGAILVGCSAAPGLYHDEVLRLNPDGSRDDFWTPFPIGRALTLRLLSNSQVLVGHSGSEVSQGVVRLQADGTRDPTFQTTMQFGTIAHHLLELQDGKILAAGHLHLSYDPVTGRSTSASIVRLTSSGRLDPTFTPAISPAAPARTLVLQPDQRIFVGGTFNSFDAERKLLERRYASFGAGRHFRPTPYAYYWLLLEPNGRLATDHAFDGLVVLPNGSVELSILAQPALPIDIQYSVNLWQWTPIVWEWSPVGGISPHRVLRYWPEIERSRHFFRIRLPPGN